MNLPNTPVNNTQTLEGGPSSAALGLVKLMRPKQWTKNFFVLGALLFSGLALEPWAISRSIVAFFAFCFLSGAVYVLNDLVDIEKDRQHPEKCRRPLAAGVVSPIAAVVFLAFLVTGSLLLSFYLNMAFGLIAVTYFVINISYSWWLKEVVIMDVMVIAIGFVLRAAAGAVVLDVIVSPWLLVCTILLALFLALSKRRHELILLTEGAGNHRQVLEDYSVHFLDQLIAIVTAATLMAYSLYTFNVHNDKLMITIPFVLYGLFRYLFLIYKRDLGGSPEKILIKDIPTLANVSLWAVVSFTILYYF